MDKASLFEEIRTLLKEAQVNTVSKPWAYTDVDLTLQVRSAIRHLKAIGVPSLTAVMSPTGQLTTEPTDAQGVLIALYVVHNLLEGDLIHKLVEGELGVYWRAGPDIIDTKTAGGEFTKAANRLASRYETLLTIELTGAIDASASVFGEPDVTRGDDA